MGDFVDVGGTVQYVAGCLYQGLHELVTNMHAMTPELRSVKLKENFARFHSNLERLMALLRWLKSSDVKGELDSIIKRQLKGNTEYFERDITVGAVYYFHAELYSKRIRTLNISLTRDLLSMRIFSHLPDSIFVNVKSLHRTNLKVLKEIEMYIKLKLSVHEKLPASCSRFELVDGVLILERRNLFRLALTLAYPDKSSAWKPVHFAILAKFSNEMLPYESDNTNILEFKVMNALMKMYVLAWNVDANIPPLDQLWSMCCYMSMMYIFRMFYLQTMLNIRFYSSVNSECTFNNEDIDKNELTFQFWNSNRRFEIAVFANRSMTTSFQFVLCLAQHGSAKDDKVYLKQLDQRLEVSLEVGNIYSLYDNSMVMCNTILLNLLLKKLNIAEYMNAEVFIGVVDYGLFVTFADINIRVCSDLTTGCYNLSSSLMDTLGVNIIYGVDKFLHEINDVSNSEILYSLDNEMNNNEIYVRNFKYKKNAAKVTATSEIVAQYMLLAFGSSYAQRVFSIKTCNGIGANGVDENETDAGESVFLLNDEGVGRDQRIYDFYLSMSSKTGDPLPSFQVFYCEMGLSKVLECNTLVVDVDPICLLDMDYLYADILNQCYSFLASKRRC